MGLLNALTEESVEGETDQSSGDKTDQFVEGETEQSGADESEHVPKSEEEQDIIVDKSHSLDLESAPESHTETDGYGDNNEESVPVEENIKHDGPVVEQRDGTEKNGNRNEDEENIKRDGLVEKREEGGKCYGMGTGTIIIKPSQGNEECNYSHQSTEATERDKNLVYDFETGEAYDIGDIDFSSFSQLYLIDAVATE